MLGILPTLRNERTPTPEELRRIFLSGDKKARTACVLTAHCGLRPVTLGNYRGTDGLRVRDFPEMRIEGDTVEFERTPTMLL